MSYTNRLAAVAIMSIFTASSMADVLSVPSEYATIQLAIDAAVIGDEVVVAPGFYEEIIDFSGKPITVRSSGGAAVTTIDAGSIGPFPGGKPIVRFDTGEGPDSVLEGFTLSSGTGDASLFGSPVVGGGVVISNGLPTIRDCTIKGNTAEVGGGVFVVNGAPTFIRCTFNTNSATGPNGDGGGLYLFLSGATIQDCVFTGNTAESQSAGIHIVDAPTEVRITGTNFVNNNASGTDGGGIWADVAAGLTIDGCEFEGNTVQEGGGGAILVQSGEVQILNSVFTSNMVNQIGTVADGGAVNVRGSSALVANCVFDGNACALRGGAVYTSANETDIVNCTFANNFGESGTAVHVFRSTGSDTLLTNSIFWQNGGMITQIATSLSGGSFAVNSCIIENGWAGPGTGNTDVDPLFAGANAGDFSLLPGSPAIDAGDTLAAFVSFNSETDVVGNNRLANDPDTAGTGVVVLGQAIDIGAHEFQVAVVPDCPADQNFDGMLSPTDFTAWITNYNNGCD